MNIIESIDKHLILNYGTSFLLKKDKISLDKATARKIILKAIVELSERFPDRVPCHTYVTHNKPFIVGVGVDGSYLVPIFQGIGVTCLKTEFTGLICHGELKVE